jgi:hypothetical protein
MNDRFSSMLYIESAKKVDLPALPMIMEPKTTGIAVVGELMFPSDLLRFESIQVGEI